MNNCSQLIILTKREELGENDNDSDVVYGVITLLIS